MMGVSGRESVGEPVLLATELSSLDGLRFLRVRFRDLSWGAKLAYLGTWRLSSDVGFCGFGNFVGQSAMWFCFPQTLQASIFTGHFRLSCGRKHRRQSRISFLRRSLAT